MAIQHTDHLVKMANDISNFFSSDPDPSTALVGMVEHLRRFWEPRMRKEIVHYQQNGGEDLSYLAKQAVAQIGEEFNALNEIGDG